MKFLVQKALELLDVLPGHKTTVGAGLLFLALVLRSTDVLPEELYDAAVLWISGAFGVTLTLKAVRS